MISLILFYLMLYGHVCTLFEQMNLAESANEPANRIKAENAKVLQYNKI